MAKRQLRPIEEPRDQTNNEKVDECETFDEHSICYHSNLFVISSRCCLCSPRVLFLTPLHSASFAWPNTIVWIDVQALRSLLCGRMSIRIGTCDDELPLRRLRLSPDNYPLRKWFSIKHGESRSAPRPVSDRMHRIDSSTSSPVPRQIA
jgi:hypothetical protein